MLETGAAWLYSATGAFLKTAAINSGLFSFNGIADGTYFVLVKNDLGLVDQLYANIDCPDGSCGGPEAFLMTVLIEGSGVGLNDIPFLPQFDDAADMRRS